MVEGLGDMDLENDDEGDDEDEAAEEPIPDDSVVTFKEHQGLNL